MMLKHWSVVSRRERLWSRTQRAQHENAVEATKIGEAHDVRSELMYFIYSSHRMLITPTIFSGREGK